MRDSGLQLQAQTLPRPPQQFSDSPQEFPLTRSVSTTTDIYATQNMNINRISATRADSGISNNYNHNRNVATNTRLNTDTETQTSGINANVDLKQRKSKKDLPQQLQQKTQRQNNIYHANFNDKTWAKNNKLVGNSIDTHNHNGHKIDRNNEDHGTDFGDDEEAEDEEPPQKLCGLKRGKRNTKDELFEEFCRRAGVRSRPKNIYYINDDETDEDVIDADDNVTQQAAEMEEEMQRKSLRLNFAQKRSKSFGNCQQHKQQHADEYRGGRERTRIFDNAFDVVDTDEQLEENGFKKFNDIEDHLYVINGK